MKIYMILTIMKNRNHSILDNKYNNSDKSIKNEWRYLIIYIILPYVKIIK